MIPTDIRLLQKAKRLELTFAEKTYALTCECLRVNSPSAEVKGHGGVGGKVPANKEHVNIIGIDPVGNYAVKLIFDDGHDTGIYSWEYLYQLCQRFAVPDCKQA